MRVEDSINSEQVELCINQMLAILQANKLSGLQAILVLTMAKEHMEQLLKLK